MCLFPEPAMPFNINSQVHNTVPLVNQSEHICGLGNHSALRFPPDPTPPHPQLHGGKSTLLTTPGAPNPGATAAGTSAPHTLTLHPGTRWRQSNGTFCASSTGEYIILKYTHHQTHSLSFQWYLGRKCLQPHDLGCIWEKGKRARVMIMFW